MQRTYSVTNLFNELKMKIGSYFRTKAHLGFNAKKKSTEVTFLSAISYRDAVDRGIYSIISVLLKKNKIKKDTQQLQILSNSNTPASLNNWTHGHLYLTHF